MAQQNLHVVMFPWFAVGHMTPFLHLSNKLAAKGHKITFLLPKKAQTLLQHHNLHPDLISFHHLAIPQVEGLPSGAETASDIPIYLTHTLATAMDRTRDQFKSLVESTKPNVIIYDFAHWIPEVAKPLGIKTICYFVVCAAALASGLVPACKVDEKKTFTEAKLTVPPPGYPSSTVVLRGAHEAGSMTFLSQHFGDGITFYERLTATLQNCDMISIRTCEEIEGKFCDFLRDLKEVILSGPVLPESDKTQKLDDRWSSWLREPKSVVFCTFGSQLILEKDQFQELLLGIELTGLPFFIALKPPMGSETIEDALPLGFSDRVKDRGVVWGGWVQQPLIISHASVGCFVNHCGFGSMWESLTSDCEIVLVPHLRDQILNTRLMTEELKVAVEVKKEDNGWFTKESVCAAIKSVMDKKSEVGVVVKKNRAKWRDTLGNPRFMDAYIDTFVAKMEDLVNS